MVQVFWKVLSMSAVGGGVILVVLLGRLLLKKAPRAVTCALWLAVLFRLLCPWSPESRFGGVSRTASVSIEARETMTLPAAAGQTGGEITMTEANRETPSAAVQASPERRAGWEEIGCGLWLLGMAVLAVYSLVSLLRLKRRLVGAVRLRENIYLADHLETAFVLGWIRPKIYLPSSLSPEEQNWILLHEQTHIRRGDPWWKALAFLALTVHWFNPLVWAAFVFFGKDMETACDEAVIRKLGPEIEPDYAASLLRLATGRRILAGAPLAFGEGDTGGRIRHILRYKKPAFWVALISALAVLALGLFLVFDKTAADSDFRNARYTVWEVRYDAPMYDFTYTEDTAPEYAILPDGGLYARDTEDRSLIYSREWTYAGTLVEVRMNRQERNALFEPSNNTVQEIMDDVTTVYEAQWQVSGAAQQNFHYLMVTRQGQLYLTVGHSADQVRWLFRLKCEEEGASALDLNGGISDSIAEKLGISGVHVFQTYEDAEVPGVSLAAWTTGEHMGLATLDCTLEDGTPVYVNNCNLYKRGGAAAGTKICVFGPTIGTEGVEKTLFIILSNNADLAQVSCGDATLQVHSNPSMTVLDASTVEEDGLLLLDRQGKPISLNVSDGLSVHGASWADTIWPELYPNGGIPAAEELPSIPLPAGQRMLILDLDYPYSETLTVTLSQSGQAEETTVLKQDQDGSFYLFLPDAQAGGTLLCRVTFEYCCYAFRIVPEAEATVSD